MNEKWKWQGRFLVVTFSCVLVLGDACPEYWAIAIIVHALKHLFHVGNLQAVETFFTSAFWHNT